MNRSDEWQFGRWPLKLEIGIRSRTLDGMMPGQETVAPRRISGGSTDTPRVVPSSPALEELLVWEFEGGNLG